MAESVAEGPLDGTGQGDLLPGDLAGRANRRDTGGDDIHRGFRERGDARGLRDHVHFYGSFAVKDVHHQTTEDTDVACSSAERAAECGQRLEVKRHCVLWLSLALRNHYFFGVGNTARQNLNIPFTYLFKKKCQVKS